MNADRILDQLINFSDNVFNRFKGRQPHNINQEHIQIISKLKRQFFQYGNFEKSIPSQQNGKLMFQNERKPLQNGKRGTNELNRIWEMVHEDCRNASHKVVPLCLSKSYDYRNTDYYLKFQKGNNARV